MSLRALIVLGGSVSIDEALRSLLKDVVRDVVREELAGATSLASDPEFVTYSDAAVMVGVSTKTVKQWAYTGRLSTYGEGRLKRVKSAEVRACMTEAKRPRAESIDDTVVRLLKAGS